MYKKQFFILFLAVMFAGLLPAAGEAEASSSATHGKYMAQEGIIIPPHHIHINSYIAQIDYDYPLPENGPFAVHCYTGNRQLSNGGQREYIQIGIKADKTPFESLPPMNLAFVIDNSGSMASDDKLDWVKESFDIFMDKVRDIDFVALIVFNSEAEVLYPSTQIDSDAKKERFRETVASIAAGGGTNLKAGLEYGYTQVYSNFRREYTNRVLFLTDGVGDSEGILEMADNYRQAGINVSTIGVGQDFDLNLMTDLAKRGGGSSRFISDRDQMLETFGDELDRMIVPAARNLEMHLVFPDYVTLIETWGYRNVPEGNGVRYSLPTLHNGDYETILAEVEILPTDMAGTRPVATLDVSYETLEGEARTFAPVVLDAGFVPEEHPVYGVSDYRVLHSSTMLHYARALIDIGTFYYQKQGSFAAAIDMCRDAKSVVLDSRRKLDNLGFEDELEILDNYIAIFGRALEMSDSAIAEKQRSDDPGIPEDVRSLEARVDSMFNEVTLALDADAGSALAVIPFRDTSGESSPFAAYLDEAAAVHFMSVPGMQVLERSRIDAVLSEHELSLSGLVDTEKALNAGALLAADFLVTGSVIPMKNVWIVFSRALDIESGEVLAVAQSLIPRNLIGE